MIPIAVITLLVFLVVGVPVSFAIGLSGLLAILLTPMVGRKVGVWDPRKMATIAFIVFAMVLLMRS